jgi:hypothetical protein
VICRRPRYFENRFLAEPCGHGLASTFDPHDRDFSSIRNPALFKTLVETLHVQFPVSAQWSPLDSLLA